MSHVDVHLGLIKTIYPQRCSIPMNIDASFSCNKRSDNQPKDFQEFFELKFGIILKTISFHFNSSKRKKKKSEIKRRMFVVKKIALDIKEKRKKGI